MSGSGPSPTNGDLLAFRERFWDFHGRVLTELKLLREQVTILTERLEGMQKKIDCQCPELRKELTTMHDDVVKCTAIADAAKNKVSWRVVLLIVGVILLLLGFDILGLVEILK